MNRSEDVTAFDNFVAGKRSTLAHSRQERQRSKECAGWPLTS